MHIAGKGVKDYTQDPCTFMAKHKKNNKMLIDLGNRWCFGH